VPGRLPTDDKNTASSSVAPGYGTGPNHCERDGTGAREPAVLRPRSARDGEARAGGVEETGIIEGRAQGGQPATEH
jgi:hypothetical protein